MPNARVDTTVPRARASNGAPTGFIRRARSLIATTNTAVMGSPIGLLLALTHAIDSSVNTYSDGGEAPHAKIQ